MSIAHDDETSVQAYNRWRKVFEPEIERLKVINIDLVTENTRLRAARTAVAAGPDILAYLREWRSEDHADAVTIHRNHVIKILDEVGRLRATIADLTAALQDCVDRCYNCGGTGTMYPHDPADVPGSAGIDCPNCSKQRAALARAQGGTK